MNRADTLTKLAALFTATPEAEPLFTDSLAPVADTNGTAPTETGWVETFDEWLSAANVARALALTASMTSSNPTVTQVTSEGTTMTISPATPVDWSAIADTLAARSPLMPAPGVGVWLVEPGPPFLPRSLEGMPL